MEHLLWILVVAVAGPLVGVEFGVAAFTNPILEGLPDDAYRLARGTGSRILGTVMPFWYITAIALLIGVAVLGKAPLAIAAVVVMTVILVLTLTILVPINNRIATWAGAGGPAPSRELARRWDRLHWLRVAMLFAAFVLVVLVP